MLATTTSLIQYLQQEKEARHFTVINAMVHAILSCGSAKDAEALLPTFLSNPGDLDHAQLLPVLEQFGNTPIAETLFKELTTDQRLNQGVDEVVLAVLGKLKYEPARPMLIYYALEQEPYNYYLSQQAVFGLLHFDLTNIQPLIKSSIEKCYGQSLFPEFVPALVCKLEISDQQQVLEQLYHLGCNTASTDCIGGIVLGFSLCGELGKPYFWKVLFDPYWELGLSSTGNRSYTFMAMQNLQISFYELYEKVRSIEEPDAQRYALDMLLEMLDIKISEPLSTNAPETITYIYTTLFGWQSAWESNNLTNLAEKLGRSDAASNIEKLMEQKLKEEMLYKNLNSFINK